MKKAKSYAQITKRYYRPEIRECPDCHWYLQRSSTLSQRTIVTLKEVVKVIHVGYRCPNAQCSAPKRTYRSAAADALALPSFTFGLDVLILAGQLHFGQHRTQEEVYEQIQEQLALQQASISRREVLYLFDAFTTLLRAASDAASDQQWLADVEKNQGIIVSVDGIQPDKGNETIYLVRDALTGRVLAAENVSSSETEVMKRILAPVKALPVKVLGTISDAQESEELALQELWPQAPHQVCQYHVLREAARAGFEQESALKRDMRTSVMPKLRKFRRSLDKQMPQVTAAEAEQLAVLKEYAQGVQTALNFDSTLPFEYGGIEAAEALDEVATSLEALEKKGGLSARSWLANSNASGSSCSRESTGGNGWPNSKA